MADPETQVALYRLEAHCHRLCAAILEDAQSGTFEPGYLRADLLGAAEHALDDLRHGAPPVPTDLALVLSGEALSVLPREQRRLGRGLAEAAGR